MQRILMSCLAILGLAAILNADAWNKKTELTVNERIMIPGATLTPGEYVVKLVDSQANRHIVQFTNEREDRVIATVLAIPNERLQPSGETEFEFYEGTVAGAPALQAWFYPGDSFGQEFAYPAEQARELSRVNGVEVPSTSGESPKFSERTRVPETDLKPEAAPGVAQSTPPPVEPEPAPARTQPAPPEARPDPTTLAQAQPAEPQPNQPPQQAAPAPQTSEPPAEQEFDELPATASPAPFFGLVGLVLLAGAFSLRRLSARTGSKRKVATATSRSG